MSAIKQKVCRHWERVLGPSTPRPSLPPPPIAPPPEPPELWYGAKDMLTVFPVGNIGRERIVGVFVKRIKENPKLISRLHPTSSQFHHELVNEIMRHPHLTEDFRSKMLENPEITAILL